jgi:mannose-1-phosphate guanylyltransferase/phosphomannomutase
VAKVDDGLWMGEGCEIDPSAEISRPCVIGPRCVIGPGAKILEKSVLGEACRIAEGAVISHSILWARSQVEPHTHLYRSIVGFDCKVSSNAAIFDGTVVSPYPAGS